MSASSVTSCVCKRVVMRGCVLFLYLRASASACLATVGQIANASAWACEEVSATHLCICASGCTCLCSCARDYNKTRMALADRWSFDSVAHWREA